MDNQVKPLAITTEDGKFLKAAQPLYEWYQSHCKPHEKIIIDSWGVTITNDKALYGKQLFVRYGEVEQDGE